MEFSLLHEKKLTFSVKQRPPFDSRSTTVTLQLQCFKGPNCMDKLNFERFVALLHGHNSGGLKILPSGAYVIGKCKVTIEVQSPGIPGIWGEPSEQCRGYVQLQNVESVFDSLQQAVKQAQCNLKLKVEVTNWTSFRQGGFPGMDLETLEFTIDSLTASNPRQQLFNTSIIEEKTFADLRGDWVGHFSITGILYPCVFEIPVGVTEKQPTLAQNILMNEIQTDIVIRAKDNVEIKAHRVFLCAHSSVFRIMFQKSYQDFKSGVVDMTDMTEMGVRAFLAYLYYSDMERPNENCSIAVQLLKAGHKYDIPALQTEMQKVILKKRGSWYNVEAVMELFLFSKNIEGMEHLKMKSVSILNKNNIELFFKMDRRTSFY